VNGDQDKSADEQSLMEAHTDRLEQSIKEWGSRQNTMSWAQQARIRDSPDVLRLYRMSGLDGYVQKKTLEVMEEGRVEHSSTGITKST
jgi:hypothetical protein